MKAEANNSTPQNEVIIYHGNHVYRNGKIVNAKGKELTVKENGTVRIKIDGVFHTYLKARVIYEAFTGKKITARQVFIFKDGDITNCDFDNIKVLSRSSYSKQKGWDKKYRVLTNEEVKEIRRIYKQKRKKGVGPTYKDLSEKYNCSISTITKVINGTYF